MTTSTKATKRSVDLDKIARLESEIKRAIKEQLRRYAPRGPKEKPLRMWVYQEVY